MDKILVPVDFSPSSVTALRFAAQLAHLAGLSVTAMYVFNSMVASNIQLTSNGLRDERSQLLAKLHAFVSYHTCSLIDVPPCEVIVAEGTPPEYIQKRSKNQDVALIVMGGMGTGPEGRREIFGGIVKAVSSTGHCPIILVPENFDNELVQRILGSFRKREVESLAMLA